MILPLRLETVLSARSTHRPACRSAYRSNLRRVGAVALAAVLLSAGLFNAEDAAASRRYRTKVVARAAAAPVPRIDYSIRPEVRQFVQEMAERHQFAESDLLQLFSQVRYSESVIRLMAPPTVALKRSWAVYRNRFLDPLRIREGVRFWRDNDVAIRRAADEYGVPEEIIVSIIGVETLYGRITGDYRVADALTVLAFDYPRRAEFFRAELEQFLLFARDNNVDPITVRGSFAGAIGLPQFMPGSIRRFAIDFDGDGRIDLRDSPVDAVGSVARFLAEHGWQRGEPTHFNAAFDSEYRMTPLIESGIEPQFTVTQLQEYGVSSSDTIPEDTRLALIDLPNGDSPTSYFLGASNFYVITRYNRSSFYAMAVIELSKALKDARQQPEAIR